LTNNPTLDLDFSGTNTIAKLIIDGVEQSQGTWGRLGSSANKTTALITGTGLLKVTSGPLIPIDVTLSIDQLTRFYDSNPKSVTPTSIYPDASFIVTYNDSSTAPTAVGNYTVVATAMEPYTGSITRTLSIVQGVSSFTWPSSSSFTYTGSAQGPVVSSKTGSSQAVTYSYVGVNPTIYSSTTKPSAAGSYKVIATVAADSYYEAKTDEFSFTISKADQQITFGSIQAKRYGTPDFSPSVTPGASTGALSYSSSNTGVATIDPTTGLVHILGVGTTTITVNQAADGNYKAAPAVTQTLTVNPGFNLFAVTAPTDIKTYGATDYTLALIRGASPGALTYESSNTGVALIDSNGLIHIVGAGTTTFTVTQAHNDNYMDAQPATQTLRVNQADQTITFVSLLSKKTGDAPFPLGATASSELVVTYESSNPAVATVSGNTVTIVGVGSTVIKATQAGNANYNAAPAVEQTLTVDKADQTITFVSLLSKKTGDAPFPLGATASSELVVTYESSNPAVATVSGNTVTIVGVGSTVIKATQAGNANYNAATAVEQTLTVTQSGMTFASWSTNATLTSDLLYKYAFGATNKNSEAQKMTSTVTGTTLILTAVVRTNDTAHLTITAKSATNLVGPWSTPASFTESIASSQSGVSDGLVRKDFKVDRGSDTKRFLKLEVLHTQ
jgi:hypothetical protein